MLKLIKWLVIVLVALVVLVVGAAMAVLAFVDPNDYRDDISRLVEENTGQELVIEGDISLSFFPWLGLDLGKTRLENREGFGDQPFVQIERAGVAVRLLPLLRREVVMDVVRLEGLLVHLVVNEEGEANWELDLPEDPDDVVTEAPDEPGTEPDPDRSPPLQVGRLDGIEISEMHVIYEDLQAGTRQEAGPVNISVGQLAFDREIPLSADWVASLGADTRVEGELDARLEVAADRESLRFHLRQLATTTYAEGLPSDGVSSRLSLLTEADLAEDTARVSDIRLETLGLRLDAEADITALRDDPRVQGRYTIPEGDLRTALERLDVELPDGLDRNALRRFASEGSFRYGGGEASVDDLVVILDDARLEASATASGLPDDPRAEGRFSLADLNLRELIAVADEELAADMDPDALTAVSAEGRFGYGGDAARLEDLVVRADDARLEADVTVRDLTGDLRAEGRYSLAELNLRELLQRLGQEVPETADPEVLTTVSSEGRFRYGDDAAGVEDLVLVLDDSRFEGSVSLRELDNPMIGFRLEGDRINADRYLPPEVEADEEAPQEDDRNGETEPVELPIEMLRELRLDGSARLGELVINDITLRDVNLTVQADGGRITVHPVGARLYGGEYNGNIRIDATGDEADIRVDERIQGVQVRELVQQFMERDLLEGTGNVTIDARARGLVVDDLLRTLAGQAEFDFQDGAVVGFNLAQMVRNAAARLQGRSPETRDEPQRTDFTELAGRLVFDGGKVRNESLNAQSPLFRVSGEGLVDLLEESIDYNLTVNLVGTLTGQGGESLDNLRGIPIPLRFRGDLMSPSIGLNLQSAIVEQQRERVREELREQEEALRERAREAEGETRERVEQEREQLEDRVREEAEDRLRGLFR